VYRNPVPAAGCIVEQSGMVSSGQPAQVLLARREFEPWKDRWYILSGFVEYDEDARREIREKTA